ncbi:filamentous hemagglutinin N-terminal domain-containing protein [Nostoc sp.]|uniref:filamentous hemagglutinin N-terminal domain-containing protein n=1 Tax=Nostoc sp. TaxID=1180 RepID=UPI002FF7E64C
MSNLWILFKSLGVAIAGAIAFSGNSAIAQIIPDYTLSPPSQVILQGKTTIIEGGTSVGSYLFHSFKEFSVGNGTTAEFRNAESVENIISRITGKSPSNIQGMIKAQYKANLFLINPNGIIFGPNASLNIGGSFVASTASSLNFADSTQFSATDPKSVPLLRVSVPIGLQFGATANPILNQSSHQVKSDSTSSPITVGLQVQPGKTLALLGGNITLEGGSLTAESGQIELGSVAGNSLVSLNLTDQAWVLGYKTVQDFQDIRLIQRQTDDGSKIPSIVSTTGNGGGNIQVQGKTVELAGYGVRLSSQTRGNIPGKDLTINTRKLIVRDSAQVGTSSISEGAAGNLIVNALESVELIGSFIRPDNKTIVSTLFSTTGAEGKAGDITIKTGRLLIQDGAEISADSSGTLQNSQIISATGKGGNIAVNAFESVELIGTTAQGDPSILSATTFGLGESGKVTITTGKLIVRDKAEINVSVLGDGRNQERTSGDINVSVRSILLDNEGKLRSNSESGKGGNIALQVQDLLLMRRNSQITTNAGGSGDGGNITINAPNGFLVAAPFGNNDITANGFSGSGGKITITAKNLFGFVPRTGADVERLDPTGETNPKNLETSDITAFSQQNPSLNGTVQINSPDADPSKGLVELPVNLVDASRQIVASCSSGGKIARSSLITTGRGGLVADPTEPLIADDAVLADWITLKPESQNRVGGIQKRAVVQAQRNTEQKSQKVNFVNEPTQIVEAKGWVMDANGNVVLVAQVPTESSHNSSLTTTSCAAH